jgi:hypothetical protein
MNHVRREFLRLAGVAAPGSPSMILSTAFLLIEDDTIKDSSIRSQVLRRLPRGQTHVEGARGAPFVGDRGPISLSPRPMAGLSHMPLAPKSLPRRGRVAPRDSAGSGGAFLSADSVLVARSPTRPSFAALRWVDLPLSGEV